MEDLNFSQRMGVEPITKELQLTSMNEELKVNLWNVSYRCVIGFITIIRICIKRQ